MVNLCYPVRQHSLRLFFFFEFSSSKDKWPDPWDEILKRSYLQVCRSEGSAYMTRQHNPLCLWSRHSIQMEKKKTLRETQQLGLKVVKDKNVTT